MKATNMNKLVFMFLLFAAAGVTLSGCIKPKTSPAPALSPTTTAAAQVASPLPSERIGVFGLPNDDAAEDLGVSWTRVAAPKWKDFEKNPRVVKQRFAGLEKTNVVATIRAVYGGKTVCAVSLKEVLSRLNNEMVERIPAGADLGDLVSCMPKDLESDAPGSYRDFVRTAVTQLPEVDAWQIENEVYSAATKFWLGDKQGEFDNFMLLFKTASAEIRAARPDVLILAPGIAIGRVDVDADGNVQSNRQRINLAFPVIENNVRRLLTEACGDFDVVDLHLYHTVENIPNRVKWLQRLMRETNCTKPIWSTEDSGPSPYLGSPYESLLGTSEFDELQAGEIYPRLNTTLDSGVDKAFYFIYKEGPTDRATENLGLLDEAGVKKPAYYAMQRAMGKA